jgi:hypothetical protein
VIVHELALTALQLAVGDEAPPTPTGDHAILLALIYVVGGGLLTILGTLVATRVGRRVPVDDPGDALDATGDYRKALDTLDRERRRSGARGLFIERLGFEVSRIRTGWEDFDDVRRG